MKFPPLTDFGFTFVKIDITNGNNNKKNLTQQKPDFARFRPAIENPTPGV